MRLLPSCLAAGLVFLGAACGNTARGPRQTVSFFDITYRMGAGAAQVKVADLDCDGHLDLIARCAGDSSLSVRLYGPGQAHWGTARHTLVWDSASDFCVADFDADGLPDVLVAGGAPVDGAALYLNDPTAPGTLVDAREMTTGHDVEYRVAAGDVNGDGLPDFVVLDESKGTRPCSSTTSARRGPSSSRGSRCRPSARGATTSCSPTSTGTASSTR